MKKQWIRRKRKWHQFVILLDGLVEEQKHCPTCNKWLAIRKFASGKGRWDGLANCCRLCGAARTKKWLSENPDYADNVKPAYDKKRHQDLRDRMFDLLGRQCAICGFSDIRALVLDHKNGDGFLRRQSGLSPEKEYRRALEFPEEHQILCANCNTIKAKEQDPLLRQQICN